MKQMTLASNEFERLRKPTRRERFLTEMHTVVPWAELVALIEPYYPKASSAGGCPPVGLERMLRIHCLQLWFELSDPAVEEALYDSRAMRAFVGIDLGREPVPDETTVMRFRAPAGGAPPRSEDLRGSGSRSAAAWIAFGQGYHCRCHHNFGTQFDQERRGRAGPGDASGEEGRAMVLREKMHVGVDSQSKVIHSVAVTPANTADGKFVSAFIRASKPAPCRAPDCCSR